MTERARRVSVFYDGKTSKPQEVRVGLRDGRLRVVADDGTLLVDWAAEKISRLRLRENEGEFCLTLGGAARLILRDPVLQQEFLRVGGVINRLPGLPVDYKIAAISVAGMVAIGLFFWQGLPLLAKPISMLIPKKIEQQLGAALYQQLTDHESKICRSEKADAALVQMGAHLFEGENIKTKIVILNVEDENAIALPGSFVLVYRGLLDRAATPDLLAGVLAHEAGHIKARHGLRRLVENSVLWLTYVFFTSDVFSVPVFVLQNVIDANYSRSKEAEADLFALALMRRKNINPTPIAKWFEEKQAEGKEQRVYSYFRSHPPSSARAALFKKADWRVKPILSPQAWVALKNICADS